jgi:hypothetical protein
MRIVLFVLLASLLEGALQGANEKLTPEQRVELIRGLSSEYATVKIMLPRSKRPLEYELGGKFDRDKWDDASKEQGPAARAGDLIQITKVDLGDDQIVFEINGGLKSGRRWYDNVSVGTGANNGPRRGPSGPATLGTAVVVKFPKGVPAVDTAEMKRMLKPLFDFEKQSATASYVDSLPPEIKSAVEQKRVIEGMDKDQVVLAIGKPRLKSRETKDGIDYEDWVYGVAPGKISFITFSSGKVVKIRESYAGLGGQTNAPSPNAPPPDLLN